MPRNTLHLWYRPTFSYRLLFNAYGREQSPTDKLLQNGTTFSQSNTTDTDRGEGHTREVGSDGLLHNKPDEFEDDDDVFVWKDSEDTEAAIRRLYEKVGPVSIARNGQWRYWGEENNVMGKAGKTIKGTAGKAKSSNRCIYKWNGRPPPARGGGNRIKGRGGRESRQSEALKSSSVDGAYIT